jgi:hypothetical protein
MPPVMERNLPIRSDLQTRAAEPSESLNPPPSRSLSLHNVVSEGLHRLNLQHSPSSSGRDGRHANDPRHAAEEPPVLSRLASNRSSRTAMPPRLYPSRESLSLNRLSVYATSQHGTVMGRSPRADPRDRTLLPIYDRSDQSALERRSTQRSMSSKLSWRQIQPPYHATARRTGADGSSSTPCHFGRLGGSGLSLGVASRRGSERAGRGVVSPRYSSSTLSNGAGTIRSRIRRHRERRRLGAEEEEEITPQLQRGWMLKQQAAANAEAHRLRQH